METFGENGLGHFLLCIKAQYCKEILRFLCSPEVLRELKSEWIHVYDESFVDTFLIKPLVKWKPVFISLQKSLESEQSTPDHKKITEEEMKIKLNQLKKMERNRLNVMISHEASSTAKFDLCCKRKIAANKLRNEKRAKLLEFLNEKKLQQDKMNKVAKEVASSHENAKIAKKKLMEEKKKSASEILKESKQLLDEAAIKAEEEKKMKKELISQIQAEELSAIMTKSRNVKQCDKKSENFRIYLNTISNLINDDSDGDDNNNNKYIVIDLTNTPGHGLLNEMSIIELRERLNQLKINKQRELEEKRDAIINDKEQKTKVLLELLNRIGKHRSVKTVAATRKMVNNGENTLINNCKVTKEDIYKNDPSLQQMLDCLSKQKEERQRYAKSDQSQKFRKYVNKGVKNKENESLKTFWDELERQREQRSRMETGATHHPSEHLITSLTA
ncbi:uncharacterized protein DC041_0004633 [Schistosoma bovis]|uniref:Uncharacterized protein n=1 Tax=Schistosoma bovis TaxID=6184 RepID=A0A430QIM3_SCHBO|nr:uncharacterized protein DC041_0004633 [Schistosoma bovis]